MLAVSSGHVLEMRDERFTELLSELNEKQQRFPLAILVAGAGGSLGLVVCTIFGVLGFFGLILLTLAGWGLGAWIDTYNRSAVVLYELEPDAAAAYRTVTEAFDGMAGCAGKWHVDSGGAVQDMHAWKRNAGASHLLDKRPTTLGYALPRVLKSNITPPAIGAGKETLYLLPDVILVVHEDKVGAVAYDRLQLQWQDSRFIEEEPVPSDAQIVGQTWKHPNKNGGPDRRFANNRQLPICLYESILFRSDNGLNELLQVSRSGVAAPLSRALGDLARATKAAGTKLALPNL